MGYNLVASVLSRSLCEVLPELLHPLQEYSVSGRRISRFKCLTRDIMLAIGYSQTYVTIFQALYDSMESHHSLACTQVASFPVGRGVR